VSLVSSDDSFFKAKVRFLQSTCGNKKWWIAKNKCNTYFGGVVEVGKPNNMLLKSWQTFLEKARSNLADVLPDTRDRL